MNRIRDYLHRVDEHAQKTHAQTTESFYDVIGVRIDEVDRRLCRSPSYKDILVLEEQLSALASETQHTLDAICIEGSSDLVLHFEGIKRIIQTRLQSTERKLKKLKDSKMGMNIDLEPERPQMHKEISEVSMMEEENRRLVEGYSMEGYRLTRMRLLEVEALQDSIFQHLTLQDERIDGIVDLTSRAGKYVHGSNSTLEKIGESGRFLRRFLFILLLCLSFILLFLHYYHR